MGAETAVYCVWRSRFAHSQAMRCLTEIRIDCICVWHPFAQLLSAGCNGHAAFGTTCSMLIAHIHVKLHFLRGERAKWAQLCVRGIGGGGRGQYQPTMVMGRPHRVAAEMNWTRCQRRWQMCRIKIVFFFVQGQMTWQMTRINFQLPPAASLIAHRLTAFVKSLLPRNVAKKKKKKTLNEQHLSHWYIVYSRSVCAIIKNDISRS